MFARLSGGPHDGEAVETDGGQFLRIPFDRAFYSNPGDRLLRPELRVITMRVDVYERDFNSGTGSPVYRFVQPIVRETLSARDIPVTVYDLEAER